jgi:hypothetical protein
MSVCLREGIQERERERERESVCVCVCEREREREKERKRERELFVVSYIKVTFLQLRHLQSKAIGVLLITDFGSILQNLFFFGPQ